MDLVFLSWCLATILSLFTDSFAPHESSAHFLVFSQLIPLSAVLSRDQNGVHHVQAGQLQRAEGGVLYLGQLAALKSSV